MTTTHTPGPCGCYTKAYGSRIDYCPTHEAAPEMLKALREIAFLGTDVSPAENNAESFYRGQLGTAIRTAARAIIAEIDGA